MAELPMYLEEDEDFEDEEEWLEHAKHEIVDYILRRYGMLKVGDINKILGWKVKEVNYVLKNLESWGRISRTKMGKTQAWVHKEDHFHNKMYY
jgi:predicted transcriptional regulator